MNPEKPDSVIKVSNIIHREPREAKDGSNVSQGVSIPELQRLKCFPGGDSGPPAPSPPLDRPMS